MNDNFFLQFDLTKPLNWLVAIALFWAVVISRYFLVAGGFYFYFFRKGKSHSWRYLSQRTPSRAQIWREIYWSVFTSFIFAVIGVLMWWAWKEGWTAIYLDYPRYGVAWPIVSFGLTLLIHETYFYFIHRFLHRPKLLRTIHRVHHLSNPPTAWTAFSFNPSEAILEAIILPAILFVVPMHPVTLVAYLSFMTVTSVINHLGVEVYPKGAQAHWLGRWFIGATHHGDHHQHFNCNYGLYLTLWDRLLRTHRE